MTKLVKKVALVTGGLALSYGVGVHVKHAVNNNDKLDYVDKQLVGHACCIASGTAIGLIVRHIVKNM